MEKSNCIFKGLGYSYLITLVFLFIYNGVLTSTDLSGDSIALATSVITTLSSSFGGFYASKKIEEKGLFYGLIIGFSYISVLLLVSYLAKDSITLDVNTFYKVLLVTIAGGIGGVLGVNFK